jgi:hypothetical protein
MFKKIFYSLTILAMLFGMFGVMGKGGVTPVLAVVPGNDDATAFARFAAGTEELLPYANALAAAWTTDGSEACGEVLTAWVPLAAQTNPYNLVLTVTEATALVAGLRITAYVAASGAVAMVPVTGACGTSSVVAATGTTATLNVFIPAGTAVMVSVGAAGGVVAPAATDSMTLRAVVAPSNTQAGGAIVLLPSFYYSGVQDIGVLGLTAEAIDPADCGVLGNTAYYRFITSNFAGTADDPAYLHVSNMQYNVLTVNRYASLVMGVWTNDVATNTPDELLGCSSAGQTDLIVPVEAGDLYHIMVGAAPLAPPAGAFDNFELFVTESQNSGGYIVAFAGIDIADDEATIATTTGGEVEQGGFSGPDADDDGGVEPFTGGVIAANLASIAHLDVAAGTYNVGVFNHNNVPANFAISLGGVATPSLLVNSSAATAGNTALSRINTTTVLNLDIYVNPVAAPLFTDMHVGITAAGVLPFWTSPGTYDVAGLRDVWGAAGPDYFLIARDQVLVPPGATINLRLDQVAPTFARLGVFQTAACAALTDVCWQDADIELNPDGVLQTRTIDVAIVGAGGVVLSDLFMTAGQNYAPMVALVLDPDGVGDVRDRDEDTFYLRPATSPFNFAAGIALPAYSPVFGRRYVAPSPFAGNMFALDIPGLTTTEEYVFGVASIDMTQGSWRDGNRNVLTNITYPDNSRIPCGAAGPVADTGTAVDVIAPCEWLRYGIDDPLLLNEGWALTILPTIANPAIGRYSHSSTIQARTVAAVGNSVVFAPGNDTFAVSSADVRMAGDYGWAWTWVEIMYEVDFTTGFTSTTYNPGGYVPREQMAAFLSRAIENLTGNAAPLVATGVFTDVPATGYWAATSIEHLDALGMLGDCNSTLAGRQFCPGANTSRAEMAKFIQTTGRWLDMNGWALGWTPMTPGLPTGDLFIDVPITYWASSFIEEMWVDGLTSGCRYEPENDTWFYCPDNPVTRAEMAKFIADAFIAGAGLGNLVGFPVYPAPVR